jgi:hypothetical protein
LEAEEEGEERKGLEGKLKEGRRERMEPEEKAREEEGGVAVCCLEGVLVEVKWEAMAATVQRGEYKAGGEGTCCR